MLGFLNRSLAPVLLSMLLGALVITTPMVNASGEPPSSVFLVLPETDVPEVELVAEPLGGGRYRLHIATEGFMFSDICLGQAEAVPVGHAHIHVDGTKVASAYSPTIEVGPLAPGEHVIDVVLRGQDHRPLAVADAGLVGDALVLKVSAEG